MAAADEFPRGWTFNVPPATAQAIITLPAIPGISHALERIDAVLLNAGQAANAGFNVQALVGGVVVFSTSLWVSAVGAANLFDKDTLSLDLPIAAPVNTQLIVRFHAAPAVGFNQGLIIKGRDL